MRKLHIILGCTILLLFSCSKDEPCKWGYGYLSGQTYSITTVSMNGANVTASLRQSNPCKFRAIHFREGSYTFENDSSCSNTDTIIYSTYTSGGKNYYAEAGVAFIVDYYDCSSFIMYKTIQGVQYDFLLTKK